MIRMKTKKQEEHPSWTAAEIHRFQAWLNERRNSTAPVSTWPVDELDFFGSQAPHPKVRKWQRS